MAPPTTIDLKLDNPTSTFQLKYKPAKGLSQPKLEALYTKVFKEFGEVFAKTYTGPKDKLKARIWEGFKDKYGILLAPDPSPNPLGDGRPLFKVRFNAKGVPTVATSIQQQKRTWYTQIQTEGSPGTHFSLERTKNQFFEKDAFGRWFKQQIHHEGTGIMEGEPFLEATLRKLLSKKKQIRTAGLNEYRAFAKFNFTNNIILGDKVENFAGLVQSRHINLDESAHAIKAGSDIPGTTYKVTKRSGASLLSPEARNNLSKFDRTSTGPNSVWARMGEYYGLSSEAGIKASDKARQYPIIPQNKSKPVDPKKIPKVQGRNFIKILTQEFINQGVDPGIAGDMAEDAYQGVRTGKGKLRTGFITAGGLATFASLADLFRPSSATSMKIHHQRDGNPLNNPGWGTIGKSYLQDMTSMAKLTGLTTVGLAGLNTITRGFSQKALGTIVNPYVASTMMAVGFADTMDDVFTGGKVKQSIQKRYGEMLKYEQVDDPKRPGRTKLIETDEKKARHEKFASYLEGRKEENLLRQKENEERRKRNLKNNLLIESTL